MSRETNLRAYRPRPENCYLVLAKGGASWAIYLSPLANVVDVALFLRGLHCLVDVRHGELTNGLLLVPADKSSRAPTREEFQAILDRGFDAGEPLPLMMLQRQALA